MATTQIDPARAEAFAGRALQILNDGDAHPAAERRTPDRPLGHDGGARPCHERGARRRLPGSTSATYASGWQG